MSETLVVLNHSIVQNTLGELARVDNPDKKIDIIRCLQTVLGQERLELLREIGEIDDDFADSIKSEVVFIETLN